MVIHQGKKGEISEGILQTETGTCYPVLEGLPRLLPDAMLEFGDYLQQHLPDFKKRHSNAMNLYGPAIDTARRKNLRTRRSFSAEWEGHDYSKGKTWELGIEEQVKRFFKECGENPESIRGKWMLDAGCGNGHLAMEIAALGARVFALDFSDSVLQAQRMNQHHECHFIQGDVEFPPFEPCSFDLVHSSGVLIHTRNTRNSFRRLSEFVKPLGKISIWVYRKRKEAIHRLFNLIRQFTSRLPTALQQIILRLFIFYPALLMKRLKGNQQIQNELWVEVLDWFTPEFRWEHEEEEVKSWFEEQKFSEILVSDNNYWGFNVTGIRSIQESLMPD